MNTSPASSGPYVLGLDGGTEGMRVGLVDPTGVPVAFVREPYPTTHAHPGWAEQQPADWWDAAVRGIRRVLEETGVAPAAVVGMALACTSYTLVCSDASGRPIRPALLWMDVRSREEAKAVAASGAECLRYSSQRGSAEWMPAKVLWLRRHEPETWAATEWICDYVEWMGFRLTGERAASVNSAAIRCYYDRLLGGWPEGLWHALDLPDLATRMASRLLNMGEVVGGLSPRAAAATGLRPGTPVAQGGADAFVGMVGLGVVAPGSVALITGSSHLHLLQTEKPRYSSDFFGAYSDAVIPGQFTVEGGQTSTGSVVSWFARMLGGSMTLGDLSESAGMVPIGSDGVMALDYWQGNRTPHVDADARGMFWGLSLHHDRAHLFRALLESVCFGTENVLRSMRAQGHDIHDMVACGGALNSRVWMQMHADVSGTAIRTTKVPEAVTLGAAILAATGAGLHASVVEASRSMVHTAELIEPDLAATEAYRPYLDLYRESYFAMKPLMHRSADLAQTVEGHDPDDGPRSELTTELHEALAEVVSAYYIEGLDQGVIAQQMHVSRSTVSRMIAKAKALGIVEIRVSRPLPADEDLQDRLVERYELTDALVLQTSRPVPDPLPRVAALAAQYVENELTDNSTIAVSWGSSLAATVDAMRGDVRHGVTVVQLIGAAGSLNSDVDGSELARQMAERLGGRFVGLNAPLLVDDADLARALLRQHGVAKVLDEAALAGMALIGLGAVDPTVSSLLRSGFTSPELLEKAARAGMVGDAAGHLLDAEGQIAHTELGERIIRLDEARLRAIPRVVAVAVGVKKVDIVRAALRSGLVHVLATDADTARAVLDH